MKVESYNICSQVATPYYISIKLKHLILHQLSTLNSQLSTKIPLSILLLATSLLAHPSYELDLYYGIGYPDFAFSNAPLAISVYPWRNVGFSTGIEYSMRKKTKKLANVEESRSIIDNDGEEFIFSYSFDKYKEELTTQILQIPLMLKYRSNWLYTAAGVKFGFPQNVNTNVSYEGFATNAYLLYDDVYFDDLPHMGFGMQKNASFKTEISAKILFMLAAEAGVRIRLGGNFAVLLGAFGDYSINKGFDRELQNIVEWIEYINEASISVGDSWKSWQPWSVGGMAKLSFGFGGAK